MVTIKDLVEKRKAAFPSIRQCEMSQILKISNKTMHYYEKGRRDISLKLANEYLETLGYELKIVKK